MFAHYHQADQVPSLPTWVTSQDVNDEAYAAAVRRLALLRWSSDGRHWQTLAVVVHPPAATCMLWEGPC